ncbi:MAG: cation transporter [Dehalococcoidales bacterium]|nr:MAG: cation transporter [Dehalococcoidales bacterium]
MFSTRTGAARLALIAVFILILVKVVVAWITGSLSITAQAMDSFLDLFGITITLFAVRMAVMPADEGHPFGHGKVEGIAAIGQAVLILAAGGLIIYSAITRIIDGVVVEYAEAGILVMVLSVVVSLFLARHLHRVSQATGSLALEASARNITADVYSATGVLVAMAVIRITGWDIVDPIIALGVASLILKAAYDVIQRSVVELTDVRLPEEEQKMLVTCIDEHRGQLAGFHAIRGRKAGNQRFIDLHLVMPKNASVEEAHDMCDHLEKDIEDRLANTSITIHVEPCRIECHVCQVLECSLRQE